MSISYELTIGDAKQAWLANSTSLENTHNLYYAKSGASHQFVSVAVVDMHVQVASHRGWGNVPPPAEGGNF